MNSPLVSIITPSFNRANFIELNIKSIMNQTYKNFEHIIVDGGSTDGTIEILKKYENKYNLKWISEPDEGMYDAINKGIKMAKGDILAYLNTDDLYFPWTLEVVVKSFKTLIADIIYGDCLVVQRSFMSIFLHPQKFNYKRLACGSGLSLPQPSTFLKKSVFNEVGYFSTNYKLFGDIEFWIRCGFKGLKFFKINEILSIVIFHDDNLHKDKKSGIVEKNRIKKSFCNDNDIFIKILGNKYIDQISKRMELLRFVFKKNNWFYFKKSIDRISWVKFLFYEMLPNRYKFKFWSNYFNSKKIFNVIKGELDENNLDSK